MHPVTAAAVDSACTRMPRTVASHPVLLIEALRQRKQASRRAEYKTEPAGEAVCLALHAPPLQLRISLPQLRHGRVRGGGAVHRLLQGLPLRLRCQRRRLRVEELLLQGLLAGGCLRCRLRFACTVTKAFWSKGPENQRSQSGSAASWSVSVAMTQSGV